MSSRPRAWLSYTRNRTVVLLAALTAVVLSVIPLLVVLTAVNGFAEVARLDSLYHLMTGAQRTQEDAETRCQVIRADVFEAMVVGAAAPGPERDAAVFELRQRVWQHRDGLARDLVSLRAVSLPADVDPARQQLLGALELYSARTDRLVELGLARQGDTLAQAASLDDSLSELALLNDELNGRLVRSEGRVEDAAHQKEVDVAVQTSVLAGVLWLALLVLGSVLARVGRSKAALLRRLEANSSALTATNAQLKTAQALAVVGSWEWSSATNRVVGSPEFYHILGRDHDLRSPTDDPLLEQVHPEDRTVLMAQRRAARIDHRGSEAEYRIVRPDGQECIVLVRVGVEVDDDGQVRVLGAVQDVTERRAVERLKAEFVAVISHELRTPLTSIRGALGLMAGGAVGPLSPQAQRMAQIAMTSSDRLVRLINDILDVEKLAAGKLRLHTSARPVGELIATAVHEMRSMANQAEVQLVVGPVRGTVLADPDRMAQTLTNLLSNAIKFSPVGGQVRIEAHPDGGLVHVTITDQGPGIPPDQLESVFDRFQQVDASDAREQEGTGLGLPICRGIVEQHGGRIWATSNVGDGSTFEFTLPTAGPATPRSNADHTAADGREAMATAP